VVLTPHMARGRPASRPLRVDSRQATAYEALLQGATSEVIVRQSDEKRRQARRSRVPAVYASVYEPCEGRTLWAFAYICPWCRLGHLGRARTEAEVSGPRRSGCGRLVVVRAARVYRSRAAA
jgi:hypothetical protein